MDEDRFGDAMGADRPVEAFGMPDAHPSLRFRVARLLRYVNKIKVLSTKYVAAMVRKVIRIEFEWKRVLTQRRRGHGESQSKTGDLKVAPTKE